MFRDKSIEVGHYWIIDSNGTKEYKADGTLVSSNSNRTSWTCPDTGSYYLELHGKGGDGAAGVGKENADYVAGMYYYTHSCASGGGGGGSGAYTSMALNGGDVVACQIANEVRFGGYQCAPGYDGYEGSANATYWNKNNFSPGIGGGRGEGAPNMITLSTSGSDGSGDSALQSYVRTQGGSGGSGGSTIGNYGDGGMGGGGDSGISSNPGTVGKLGAIIIKKQ